MKPINKVPILEPVLACNVVQDSNHRFVTESQLSSIAAGPGGAIVWGSVGGDIEEQTDLQNALGLRVSNDDPRLSDARTPLGHTHPASEVTPDGTRRFVTDVEKTTWNSKADGSHNHDGSYAPISHSHDYAATNHNHNATYAAINHNHDASYSAIGHTHNYAPALGADDNYVTDAEKVKLSNLSGVNTGDQDLSGKQNTLVSGTNIKTINGNSLLGSGDIAIAGGSDPFTAKLRLVNDVATGANVTPVNLTGMSFTYEANSVYKIEWYMAVTAALATTGHGFGLNCTTAPVLTAGSGTSQLTNTGTVTGWQFIANNAVIGVTSGIPTANGITPSLGQGILVTNATTGGTCQFIFRSETTAVTTCKAGSVITVMKIS